MRSVIPVLGISPRIGRALLSDEYRFGATPGVMLGHKFWKAHFAGDPSAVGRTLQVGAERHTIVGVLPPEADRFPAGGADVWTALTFPPSSFLNQRGSIALSEIGRLRGNATIAAARTGISTIAARLAATYPDTNRDRTVRLDGLQDAMVGPVRPMIILLALPIAMLLAVACANITNLLLAQAHARTLEFGIRGAVGASPARLARQRWTESLALFGVAGALGVAIAQPLAQWLVSRYPETLPLAADVALDGRVLAISAACTLAAALLAGFPRTRRLRDMQVAADLRGDPRSGLTRVHRRMTTSLSPRRCRFRLCCSSAGSCSPERLSTSPPQRPGSILTGTLAALTLLLAIVGLHGVVSFAVTQRTREIGVRLALGQRPVAVVRVVMFDTLRTIALGAVPGVLASVYAGRWLSSVVMVNADRTAASSGVVAIFIAAALAAAAGPAWRASRSIPSSRCDPRSTLACAGWPGKGGSRRRSRRLQARTVASLAGAVAKAGRRDAPADQTPA